MDPKNSKKNNDTRNKRLEILAPLLYNGHRTRSAIARIAQDNNLSVKTLKRWLAAYDEHGAAGLIPAYKGSCGNLRRYAHFDDLLARACEIRIQDPHISVENIIYALESENPNIKGILKRSTLQHHLELQHCSRRERLLGVKLAGRRSFGRYAKKHPLDLVECDVKEFSNCRVFDENGAPVKLFMNAFIDSCTRRIMSYKVWTDQKSHLVMDSCREMVESYGAPDAILTDNGSIYRSKVFNRACRLMNIKLKFCRPKRPEGKGLVERLCGELNAIEDQFSSLGSAPATLYINSIHEWVRKHNADGTAVLKGRSPNQVFFSDSRKPKPIPQDILAIAFKHSDERKVHKDGTFSYGGVTYQIPPEWVRVGSIVEILIGSDNSLELILPDFSTIPLSPMELKPDVSPAVLKPEPKPSPVLKNAAFMLALLREKAKHDGTYTTEEEFMRQIETEFAALPDDARTDLPPSDPSRGAAPASPYLNLSEGKF